jgi:hypothetical protein
MDFHVFPFSRLLLCSDKRKTVPPVLVLLGILACIPRVEAQASVEANSNQQSTQILLERIDQLELKLEQVQTRLSQLEAAQSGKTADPPQSTAEPKASSQAPAPVPSEDNELEKMDVSKTLLNIRGFGDVGLYGGNQKGQTTSFTLGELDLFITSHMSEKFKFLTELVFEVHKDNEFEEDLERVLLEYSYNDYLQLAAGRFHTDIGYYNTAYHHTTWFQTTTNRPFLFQFEDEGGILPIHNVGVSASGQIPSGKLGLHYVAEVANGRASSSPSAQPVQNRVDENNHKAVNLAVFVPARTSSRFADRLLRVS